jgi:hypothetical protein
MLLAGQAREQSLRFGGSGIERERPFELGACRTRILLLDVGLGKRDPRGGRVGAPDGDLERFNRLGGPAGAQVEPSDQERRRRERSR